MAPTVAVVHAAAVENQRAVEHRTGGLLRRLELAQERSQLFEIEAVYLRQFLQGVRIAAVVRQAVIGVGEPQELRERMVRHFEVELKRANARRIGLERQENEIEHRAQVLLQIVMRARI